MKQITTNKQKSLLAAKKAIGTLNKVLEMIEQDKYCPDIIQQLDSATGLLRSTRSELLQGHLAHCLEHKLHQDKEGTITELMKIYNLRS
jgi:DNA-binding FrmR family transcriptional regulator